jgi:hypothetical protein
LCQAPLLPEPAHIPSDNCLPVFHSQKLGRESGPPLSQPDLSLSVQEWNP